jgi:hypothetical protein
LQRECPRKGAALTPSFFQAIVSRSSGFFIDYAGDLRIPRQSYHSFHTKAATDSMTSLPPIPRQSCHRFQEKAATPAVRTGSVRRWGNPIGILHFSHIVREEQMPAQR